MKKEKRKGIAVKRLDKAIDAVSGINANTLLDWEVSELQYAIEQLLLIKYQIEGRMECKSIK